MQLQTQVSRSHSGTSSTAENEQPLGTGRAETTAPTQSSAETPPASGPTPAGIAARRPGFSLTVSAFARTYRFDGD
jgi:hypothetical protein